jgi:4-hydroxy-tetrahydrodipicolinate reductase
MSAVSGLVTHDSRLTPMRLAIVGSGRMGQALATHARVRGHQVHSIIGSEENAGGRGLTAERLAGADVALEFTRPDAVVANLRSLIELGIPVVTGTTGWSESLPEITALVQRRHGALLHAPNFSVGVSLFLRAARELARSLRGRPEFSATIREEHHAAKVDAPSGTALVLQQQLRGEDAARPFPITSVREGTIPGTHALIYDSAGESITLSHVARGREVFAAGALSAAEWLPGRVGVFTFEEMLLGGPA